MRDEDKSNDELIEEVRALRAKLTVQDRIVQRNEEKLRILLDAMHDSMVMLDANGTVMLTNHQLAESMGLRVEDIVGKTIFDVLPTDIASARMEQLLSALKFGQPIGFEDERRGRMFHHSAIPIENENGLYDHVVVFIQDITESRQVEEARDRAQKYLNLAASILVSLNRQGEIVLINKAGYELLGYTQDELIGRNWFDTYIPARVKAESWRKFQQLLNGELEASAPSENLIVTKSGEERIIEWHHSILARDITGEVDEILSSGKDITERKYAEVALQESESRFRAILDAIPDLMFRLARDGTHLEFYAPHLGQLFVQPENFLGKRVEDVLPREAAAKYAESIQRTLEQRDGQVFEYHLDFPDRGRRHYEARMVAAEEDEVLVIVRDITERKETETQQIEMAVQHERIQLLEEVISDLSHDIKTPLSIIRTKLYLLKRQPDPEKRQQYIRSLDSEVQRLSRIVDDILVMARLDERAELTFYAIDVNKLIENMSRSYSELVNEKGITLICDLDTDIPPVLGNEGELNRTIANLIENAINYTPNGNSISVRTYLQKMELIVEIKDTGIGIGERDLPHIFDRFYRADTARGANQGGTGLGLAIAKKIIELHGGRIEVESVIEEGTTFNIRLPIRRLSDDVPTA